MSNYTLLKACAYLSIGLIQCVLLIFSGNVGAKQPDDINRLKKAVELRKSQEYQQAIELLESLKQKHFDHKRINIELAINFIKLEKYDESIVILQHLQSLILSTSEKTKLNSLFELVQSKLDAYSKKANKSNKSNKSPYKFLVDATFYYGVDQYSTQFPIYEYLDPFDEGLAFEDNFEFDEELIELRSDEVDKQENNYFAQQLQSYYLYKFQEKKGYKFIFSGLAAIYQRQIKKSTNLHYRQYKLEPALSLIINDEWLINLKIRSRFHEQNSRYILSDNSMQLFASLPLLEGRVKFGYNYRKKDNKTAGNNAFDATISSPWLEYVWRPASKIKFQIGSRYRIYNTADKFNQYRNVMFYSSLNYKLSNNTSVYFSYNNSNLAYVIDDLELVNWGDETKHSFSAGGKFKINQQFSWGINGHVIDNQLSQDAGEDQWKRLEVYFTYRF